MVDKYNNLKDDKYYITITNDSNSIKQIIYRK